MNGHINVSGDYRDFKALLHAGTPLFFGLDDRRSITFSVLLTNPQTEAHNWSPPQPLPLSPTFRDLHPKSSGNQVSDGQAYDAASTVDCVNVASDGTYVHVFRHVTDSAKKGALFVDRFILDVENATLVRVLEVRQLEDGSWNYKDSKGSFYEPATRLPIDSPDGQFAVILVPTSVPGIARWQVLTKSAPDRLRLLSYSRTERGVITDEKRTTWYTPNDAGDSPGKPQQLTIKGFDESEFTLTGARIRTGLSAGMYGRHVTVKTDDSETTVKDDVHVMLAFGSDQSQVGIVDFQVGKDGILALPPDPLALGRLADGGPWTVTPSAPDFRGLQVAANVLAFATTTETPLVLDSADGYVHVYYRDPLGGYAVSYFDSLQQTWLAADAPGLVENGEWVTAGRRRALGDVELLFVGLATSQSRDDDPSGMGYGSVGVRQRQLLATGEFGVWVNEALATGWRGRSPRGDSSGFAGTWLTGGGDIGALFGNNVGQPDGFGVCDLGGNRVLLYSSSIQGDGPGKSCPWAIWEYDATAAGWRGDRQSRQSRGFPGRWVAGGSDFGHVWGQAQGYAPAAFAICGLPDNRLLFYGTDPMNRAWAIVKFDPAAPGWRAFSGEWLAGGNELGSVFGQQEYLSPANLAVRWLGNGRLLFYGSGNVAGIAIHP